MGCDHKWRDRLFKVDIEEIKNNQKWNQSQIYECIEHWIEHEFRTIIQNWIVKFNSWITPSVPVELVTITKNWVSVDEFGINWVEMNQTLNLVHLDYVVSVNEIDDSGI